MKSNEIMNTMMERTRRDCIDCGLCTKNCEFLTKYDMNLKDFCNRENLRYSCFLCDTCRAVCPKDLSGREIALEMRRKNTAGTFSTKFMKNNYKLRNNSNKKSSDLLFLGCNYPGFYPKTCEKLIEICEDYGIDWSVDCCKKPVYELGDKPALDNLSDLFKEKETKRIITCCPNCFHFLKDKLEVEVIDAYQFLIEKGIGTIIEEEANIFFPCSDRYNHEIFKSINKFIPNYKDSYKSVNCCGLGGGAKKHEPSIIEATKNNLTRLNTKNIYTYCSSCSGIFRTYELKNIKNVLSEVLDVHEEVSSDYAKNVMRFKFKKRKLE